MCFYGVPESTCCALCMVEEERPPTCDRTDATDRLSKCVICFGYTWTWSDATASDLVHQSEQSEGGGCALVDQACTLPYRGVVDMGTHALVSDPVVVHSWCAQCVTQLPTSSSAWSDAILDALDVQDASAAAAGSSTSSDTSRPTCIFCGAAEGWMTRCLLQTAASGGACKLCGTSSFFHPSCGVWAGMQRTCRVEGYGLLCVGSKKWRNVLFPGLSTYLDYASGINWFVNGSASLLPPAGTKLKGERYESRKMGTDRDDGGELHHDDPLRSAIVECMHDDDDRVDLLRKAVLDAMHA